MEIEKTLVVAAPRERVWALLMDPHVMTGAVPGMQSIEVISPTEYKALMKVKVSFISAKFTLHTHIVEQREPEYLRAEGNGEDKLVASSLKQVSEVFLNSTDQGGTELRIKVNVDVLGRLGSFGLSGMKNKADRMWEEFGQNLAARIDGSEKTVEKAPEALPVTTTAAVSVSAPGADAGRGTSRAAENEQLRQEATPTPVVRAPLGVEPVAPVSTTGWLARLLGGSRSPIDGRLHPAQATIRVEVRETDRTVVVEWPLAAANECQGWLRELLKPAPN